MMMLVDIDHPGLVVLPTHRILFGLPDFSAECTLAALSGMFAVRNIAKEQIANALAESEDTAFVFYADGKARLLTLKDSRAMSAAVPDRSDAYRALDVAVLHSLILEPCFGIDRENMARGENLRYTRDDAAEAVAEVDAGRGAGGFCHQSHARARLRTSRWPATKCRRNPLIFIRRLSPACYSTTSSIDGARRFYEKGRLCRRRGARAVRVPAGGLCGGLRRLV